jgi:phage terminase large subunit-like protein
MDCLAGFRLRRCEMSLQDTEKKIWIRQIDWDICAGMVDSRDFDDMLKGRVCYGALDVTSDISAFVLDFPVGDELNGKHYILCRFFASSEKSFSNSIRYSRFIKGGYVIETDDRVAAIIDQIGKDKEKFQIKEIALDRYVGLGIAQKLLDIGVKIVEGGRGFLSVSAPTKELGRIIRGHSLLHGENPVLSWMFSNVELLVDSAGNIKVDPRLNSQSSVSGIHALIMAVSRFMAKDDENSGDIFVQEITRVQALTVQPGDIVFFETDERFSETAYARLIDQLQKVLPGQKIVVLDGGLKIESVLHPDGGTDAG